MLDEDYFMYGEDIDWAYRIKEKGWEIWFNPQTSIHHKKKQSGRANAGSMMKRKTDAYFYETMKLFYKKHYEKVYPRLVTGLVYLALDLRITVLSVLGK
ncbi:MAG: Glycosyl transferase family 2 [Candidatus Gottesmanbacteria bacterium GW2011_GWB1_44_11c]|uniref:Glycosyl transferase family 2 n=1 Tax=Candidatus Gottesmanbacteria bacterium GW2011_GWB1_44_11c TaxID=1618447 RepID=A0A0G1GXM6_9BACT|nr:MAG: Glycosyl transferase family 2 [Candidatus Gottesmanbacteria bacterium GW2011_GWB1_44_11c]